MRRSLLVALSMVVALMAASTALADNLNKVVTGLRHAAVYVEPSTPGTTPDTASELTAQLHKGDNIVVVLLPANAVSGDLTGFARKLDQKLGGNNIVGLAAGDQFVAYSTLLPAGTADDLMHNAASVSTNPAETLGTFIGNVHDWQLQNPQQPASKPKPAAHAKHGGGFPWWILGFVIGLALIAGFYLATRHPKQDPISGEEFIKFRSPVRDDLDQIAKLRTSVNDQALRVMLTQVCTDVEAYFDHYCNSPQDDAGVFRNHLQNLRKVLEKYVEIQNSPARYYDNPAQLMESGRQAVADFEQYVIASIKRGSRADLTDYSVNTDILSAQKLKYVQ